MHRPWDDLVAYLRICATAGTRQRAHPLRVDIEELLPLAEDGRVVVHLDGVQVAECGGLSATRQDDLAHIACVRNPPKVQTLSKGET